MRALIRDAYHSLPLSSWLWIAGAVIVVASLGVIIFTEVKAIHAYNQWQKAKKTLDETQDHGKRSNP